MKKMAYFIFLISACGTMRIPADNRHSKPKKYPDTEVEIVQYKRPVTYILTSIQYSYSPKTNEIVLMTFADNDVWEIVQTSLSTGEHVRFQIKGEVFNMEKKVRVEEPFEWERLVNESCNLRKLRSNSYRDGTLLVSDTVCEDMFDF